MSSRKSHDVYLSCSEHGSMSLHPLHTEFPCCFQLGSITSQRTLNSRISSSMKPFFLSQRQSTRFPSAEWESELSPLLVMNNQPTMKLNPNPRTLYLLCSSLCKYFQRCNVRRSPEWAILLKDNTILHMATPLHLTQTPTDNLNLSTQLNILMPPLPEWCLVLLSNSAVTPSRSAVCLESSPYPHSVCWFWRRNIFKVQRDGRWRGWQLLNNDSTLTRCVTLCHVLRLVL